MQPENIHIEASRTPFNYHMFLLFIPAIVFVFIMAIIIRSVPKEQVLGNTSQQQK